MMRFGPPLMVRAVLVSDFGAAAANPGMAEEPRKAPTPAAMCRRAFLRLSVFMGLMGSMAGTLHQSTRQTDHAEVNRALSPAFLKLRIIFHGGDAANYKSESGSEDVFHVPWQPRSEKPMSSARMTRRLGFWLNQQLAARPPARVAGG